ncbi:MAG: ATP-binding protein, partial [Lachnospiraceae bacterium]|nr:ATP-binding protein [Lachnospiraceae bacterium]
MNKITLLSNETIDKISAGEVVERPVNVVKELVENSIDAGATSVTVEIKGGGSELIRVTDNGSGIERDECPKAFLRHATSKLTTIDDLETLVSLGFRGEALSSISAVSKTEMITKVADSLLGTHIVVEGGRLMENSE